MFVVICLCVVLFVFLFDSVFVWTPSGVTPSLRAPSPWKREVDSVDGASKAMGDCETEAAMRVASHYRMTIPSVLLRLASCVPLHDRIALACKRLPFACAPHACNHALSGSKV